jgi:hypothetical protein
MDGCAGVRVRPVCLRACVRCRAFLFVCVCVCVWVATSYFIIIIMHRYHPHLRGSCRLEPAPPRRDAAAAA